MNTRSIILLVAVAAVCAATAEAASAVGSWDEIGNIDNPHVQELGRWAVAEASKTAPANRALTFNRVFDGYRQVVAGGVNYLLRLEASSPAAMNGRYKAVVFEQASGTGVLFDKLVSFDPMH